MTVRRPFLSPFWLIFSLPVYIGWRIVAELPFGPTGIAVGIAALLVACVVIPLSVRTRSMRDQTNARRLAWVGLTSMGFLSTLFVFTLLRDIVMMLARLVTSASQVDAWLAPSAALTVAASVLATLLGFIIARRPRIVAVEIPVRELPEGLRGFSIAQISDVHVGPTIRRPFVESVVARVNSLNADVIAVTGDLVDGSVPDLAPHTAPLRNLTARHGVYMVTGNHEYYSGEPAWTAEFRRLRMHVLKNEHVVLQHHGELLVLAGVTDYSAHHFDPGQRSDPRAALLGAPANAGARILLAHQPSSSAAAQAAGFDVQLSGHTHGGQFFPWNLLVGFFQPFAGGLNRLEDMMVYVSRGTGYWGPPNRFGVPAEITYITLVPAA